MIYGIIADIHANLEALTVAVNALQERNVEKFICSGDIVGYGANPEECIDLLRSLDAKIVAGNHDWAAIYKVNINFFNAYARDSAIWTSENISKKSKDFLEGLPLKISVDNFEVTHGTFDNAEEFNYIQSLDDADLSFSALQAKLGFLSHSHIAMAFFKANPTYYTLENKIQLKGDIPTIINTGSVGQPRDENPRSSCAVYDTESGSVEILRLEYDIAKTADKIIKAGLPEINALRLFEGR